MRGRGSIGGKRREREREKLGREDFNKKSQCGGLQKTGRLAYDKIKEGWTQRLYFQGH